MKLRSHRARVAALFAALLAVAALGAGGAQAADPSLTLSVNLGGALEVVLGNGTRIRTAAAPGASVPPGPYLLIVHSEVPDDRDVFHLFHISGPGVEMSSDLLPCENPRELLIVTLRPNSTYVYEDSRHPQLNRVVFTTTGDGSSASTSSGAAGPATGKTSGTVANKSLLGSEAVRATLNGTVGAGGELTLRLKGKAVSALKTGRYRIAVADATRKGGFTIQRPNRKTVAVTGTTFVGRRSVTLDLVPGRWTFYSAAGPKRSFVVAR